MPYRSTLLLISLFSLASADLSGILKTCRDVSCDPRDGGDASSFRPDHSFKWMAAGLPMIFWQAVRSHSLFNLTSLSSPCQTDLIRISNNMQQGKEWAYEFMDASGKTPAGLLRATITAIGDYDQCLDIDNHGIQGKYCMMDMHHLKRSNMARDELALHKVNTFAGYPFLSALCVPSTCSKEEIQSSVKHLLKPYMIKVAGDINCDTKESTGWLHRLTNLRIKQIISLVVILTIVATVIVCSWIDLYHRYILQEKEEPGLISSLSFFSASHKLFYAKPGTSYDILAFDAMKFATIFFGVLSHLVVCAEAPLSYGTIANHRFLNDLMKAPATQFLVNDAGLLGIPFLTGIATFSVLFPMAKKAKVPYLAAIFDRFVRFLPPILVLTACEFIWPIIGNGPLYTRVADFNLAKCENNWLYNVFFVNNYFLNSVDICGGHSFYSSIDMQLFILGLIGIFIFSRSEKAGVLFSITMALFGTVKVAHSAIKYDTSFSLFVVDPVPHKIVEYFHYIHMQTSSYMAAYFTGFLLSYARMNGYFLPKFQTNLQHIKFIVVIFVAYYAVNINSSLRNVVNVYPDHLNWLFISLNRIFQLLADVLIFIYVMSFKPETAINQEKGSSNNDEEVRSKGMVFSPFKALCRLCFPLYICNYLYIRTEFFTRRFLEPSGIFWMMKRMSSSVYFVYIFTVLFHLMLLAPLDAVREHLMRPSRKPKDDHHDE